MNDPIGVEVVQCLDQLLGNTLQAHNKPSKATSLIAGGDGNRKHPVKLVNSLSSKQAQLVFKDMAGTCSYAVPGTD